MGLESLTGVPAEVIIEEVLRRRKICLAEGHGQSANAVLAREFIKAGTQGLKELRDRMGVTSNLKTYMEMLPKEIAAIIGGNLVLGAERAIADGNIRVFDFAYAVNEGLLAGGIKLDTSTINPGIVPISDSKYNDIVEAAKRDRTLSYFIEDLSYSPDPIAGYVNNIFTRLQASFPKHLKEVAQIYRTYADPLAQDLARQPLPPFTT